jgi:hypothetical protein
MQPYLRLRQLWSSRSAYTSPSDQSTTANREIGDPGNADLRIRYVRVNAYPPQQRQPWRSGVPPDTSPPASPTYQGETPRLQNPPQPIRRLAIPGTRISASAAAESARIRCVSVSAYPPQLRQPWSLRPITAFACRGVIDDARIV